MENKKKISEWLTPDHLVKNCYNMVEDKYGNDIGYDVDNPKAARWCLLGLLGLHFGKNIEGQDTAFQNIINSIQERSHDREFTCTGATEKGFDFVLKILKDVGL